MIIKSPFRDYYDYVANKYGVGDPKIMYVRKRLCEPENKGAGLTETCFTVESTNNKLCDLLSWYW